MAIIPNDEKVFMVSNTTNTTYSGSQALKDMNEWYTMEDVKNTVLPYKVYTALLTQIDGDNQGTLIDEPLTIGVTYKIGDQAGGTWDFTNVGAPNNDVDTYFVATGTTPNSWGNGTLIYIKGAPVVTVLENTIGDIWFTYNDVGSYFVNSNSLFTGNKTYLYIQAFLYGPDEDRRIGISLEDSSTVQIITTNGLIAGNANLYNTSLEIRVYN
jgi:hypothetical protein